MKTIRIYPVTPDRWGDFEKLFGPRGACAGCWCMYWKLPRKLFTLGQGDQNRHAQKNIISSGHIPGLIAYSDNSPSGWVAVEPRENYTVLANSRILKPLDELQVWSVPCFFVAKNYRNQGLSVALLKAAIDYVAIQRRQSTGRLSGGTAPVREGASSIRIYRIGFSFFTSWIY